MKDFLKSLGAVLAIGLFLALCVICVIGELFPALLPDWVFTALGIVSIPFWVIFFVTIFKEWRSQRKAKKPSPGGKVAERKRGRMRNGEM